MNIIKKTVSVLTTDYANFADAKDMRYMRYQCEQQKDAINNAFQDCKKEIDEKEEEEEEEEREDDADWAARRGLIQILLGEINTMIHTLHKYRHYIKNQIKAAESEEYKSSGDTGAYDICVYGEAHFMVISIYNYMETKEYKKYLQPIDIGLDYVAVQQYFEYHLNN